MNNIIKFFIAAGLLALFIILLIILLRPLFRQPRYIQPSGSHKVGTFHTEIMDSNRMEGGSPRRISVRFFYPATDDTEGQRMAVQNEQISKAFAELYRIPTGGGESELSFSYKDAPPLPLGPFPVIIFSHGGFSYDTQNLSNLEELASRGYIVATVSHTGEALLTLFPDGSSVPMVDSSYMKQSMSMGKEQAAAYRLSIEQLKSDIPLTRKKQIYKELGDSMYKPLEPYLQTRIEDIHFLLGRLADLQHEENFPLNGLMDLEKIGMFGHSFGGITTSYICSEENTPVDAGINLDAPVITYGENEPLLKKPFAFFYSTQTSIPRSGTMDLSGCNNYYAQTSRDEVYSLSVRGTAHYNYSDFNFMPPILRVTPMLGSINGREMARILNHTVADFFDMTLKGENSTLYSKKTLPYPDLTLKKGAY